MTKTRNDALKLVTQISTLAGSKDFLRSIRAQAKMTGLARAIDDHDTPALFDWLMWCFSYQGISDRISDAYIEAHGNATWAQVRELMVHQPGSCSLLMSFETYHGCRYRKLSQSCANPNLIASCPVPALPVRKGDLNQLAFSLYLFLRDECQGDLINYLDNKMGEGASGEEVRVVLTRAFSRIHAVSSKLINMALSDLLLSGGPSKGRWKEVGIGMIAIDSLVHNFLHRTGILAVFGLDHPYGPSCHGSKGCAAIIREIASQIDARSFNPRYPACFPRFVQHAIWSFCTEQHLNICNGRKIDDRRACAQLACPVGGQCSRLPLNPVSPMGLERQGLPT